MNHGHPGKIRVEGLPGLDEKDRALLNRVQSEVPLEVRPFATLGRDMGITEDEVLERLKRLWERGMIRRLGPIINYPAWGMSGVLVAANVDRERADEVKALVRGYPEITHAYLRDHPWNFWFTVIAENEEARNEIIRRVTEAAGLKDVRPLERRKTFKLKVRFKM